MGKLQNTFRQVFNFGITADLSEEEKRKTRSLNLIALAGLPCCIIFSLYYLAKGITHLAGTGFIMAICCVAILAINKERKYLSGRLFLSILGMVVFSMAAIYYQNGAEYFLLLNIIATVILFKQSFYFIPIAVANALLFLLIKYFEPFGSNSETIPHSRVIVNIGWTLLFMILALHYYKNEHLWHHIQIEESNEQLKEQQEQLLLQKNELVEKTNQLEVLNHTKEKLFSVIAHDMRTPIAGLKSSLDLYNSKVITQEEFDGLCKQLTVQVDNLYNTLDNLLFWSQSQLNGIQAKAEHVAVKPVVLQTISLLLENAKLKQLQFDQKIPDNLKIYADANHLRLVLRNLLSNAIKFSHPRGVISIEANQHHNMVEIKVTDTGIGMNPQTIDQLFKSATLQTHRGTQNEAGTGLGLALSREFIEKNKGQISVISREGEGSCFTILLPSEA